MLNRGFITSLSFQVIGGETSVMGVILKHLDIPHHQQCCEIVHVFRLR